MKELPIVVSDIPANPKKLYQAVDKALREREREWAMELVDTEFLVAGGLMKSREASELRRTWKSLLQSRMDNSKHNGNFSR